MAAKKKKKAKKAARKAPAKKTRTKAKKASAKKAKRPAAKKAGKAAKKKVVKAAARKAAPKKTARKAVKKKKQIVGEGDYAATRKFDRDEANFVARNKARIPALGKAAEAALDGPDGDALREAEASAAGHSRDTF
jgi:hypothetical protein